MTRISLFLLTFIITGATLLSQVAPDKYYVQFTDKNNSPYSINNPEEFLSQRAIDRREAHNIPVDMKDLPVNPQYLQGVQDAGAAVINPTKWLNGVVIYTDDPAVISSIEALPYVESVEKAPGKPVTIDIEKDLFMNESYGDAPAVSAQLKNTSIYDYGNAFNQINMIKGDQIHELGYRGEGILIGVLDAGFSNVNTLPVFDTLWDNGRIIATRDFVNGGVVTFDQHPHGTMVLSTMGGNYSGEIVGTAPEASYILIRTEYGPSELIIEEYNWVSGAEYADSLGADVLNTSLGYSTFPDDTLQNHTYEDMDGNTTPITIGADIAASRGMVVVNSAGNSGTSDWYYITAPADGDSVFTIGAVDPEGVPANFSSHGPTYDERIKPNVAAQGSFVYVANPAGSFSYEGGTSFSSPITAGMMACLWQANPDMNNMELINAVQQSGSIASSPDYKIGYGIPDFMVAHSLTVPEQNDVDQFSRARVYPNPFNTSIELTFNSASTLKADLTVTDMTGRLVYSDVYSVYEGVNNIRINKLESMPSGIYFLRLGNGASGLTSKLVKQ